MTGEKSYKALLVIDMIKDRIAKDAPDPVPAGQWIIENIAGEIRYAREKGRPVIYVCDQHRAQDPEVIDELTPQPGDHVVTKNGFSSFYQTKLESLLDELEIEEVLLCGVLTNTCILYAAMDSVQRGLRVIVPETCVAALNEEDHLFALRQIHQVLLPENKD